ncbi:transglutaminase [Methylopila jiangsuensis]|uniref:Transglutaminase n=1 Tax=Methylopila jiangsuensis TaxID=586230 RepID=A0A9W6JG80_9HYPH|nr:transglutaminase family protein [Methylopila jiangsuensis]MDR6285690.1 transglutaminase-like putative cysteine protease [Methylopila jiangsuensis]GLK75449.1 transglutaminase [Methylopila jiangsuensis]
MRLKIRHETAYRYETPAASVTQTLRMTPRNFEGQHVIRWRLDVDRDCRLRSSQDAFGNVTHVFVVDGPVDELTVLVEGEVETQDVAGVVRSAVERFPPALYLRETDLTGPDRDIAAFAEQVREETGGEPLAVLHGLLEGIHREIAFDPKPSESDVTAAETFRRKRGLCQDLTHVFLVAARHLGTPARYVSGYIHDVDPETAHEAGHAWAEAHVPGLGWVAFDPCHKLCPTDAYVRVAVGLDYYGAAPFRVAAHGGLGESFTVKVEVEDVAAARGFSRN